MSDSIQQYDDEVELVIVRYEYATCSLEGRGGGN